MTLAEMVRTASDKTKFVTVQDYLHFCERYCTSVAGHLQAVIVAQNEPRYRFFRYNAAGHFNVTSPLNSDLMFGPDDVGRVIRDFLPVLRHARDVPASDTASRDLLIRSIYTVQQCIGAALDALPSGESNRARKVNGDLFERFVQLMIRESGVDCHSKTVLVPFTVDGKEQLSMS